MLENGPEKQAQGAPERHRKMLQKSIKNLPFLYQNPSSEASWAPPAAEKRPTRAPRGPRGAKTTQSEHQDRPKSVSRAIFSKIRPQGCGSQPSRTLCLLWQTEKVTGPRALKRRLLSHFAGAKGVSDHAVALPPPSESPHDAPQTTLTNLTRVKTRFPLPAPARERKARRAGARRSEGLHVKSRGSERQQVAWCRNL